jgi:hypothetical protein
MLSDITFLQKKKKKNRCYSLILYKTTLNILGVAFYLFIYYYCFTENLNDIL